ncbi:MAG: response regulator [Bacteroidia bacterium]|nr:response regulator [Bacteroidia bacterium]
MSEDKKNFIILVAEDDDDDYQFALDIFREIKIEKEFYRVYDGEELMDFLQHKGKYESGEGAPKPNLLFIDITMPKKSGADAIKEIKADPNLAEIPIFVFTTAEDPEEVKEDYDLPIDEDFIIHKPESFESFKKVFVKLKYYLLEVDEKSNSPSS